MFHPKLHPIRLRGNKRDRLETLAQCAELSNSCSNIFGHQIRAIPNFYAPPCLLQTWRRPHASSIALTRERDINNSGAYADVRISLVIRSVRTSHFRFADSELSTNHDTQCKSIVSSCKQLWNLVCKEQSINTVVMLVLTA